MLYNMLKLIKKIRRHFELRVQQEVLCELCCQHSQDMYVINSTIRIEFPRLNEFSRVNRAVSRIDKIIPSWYWVIAYISGSDLRMRVEIIRRLKSMGVNSWCQHKI